MPETTQECKPASEPRRPLYTLSVEELVARRCELAEQLDPLWQRLDAIDDELMHRRRAARRTKILTGPVEKIVDDSPAALATEEEA